MPLPRTQSQRQAHAAPLPQHRSALPVPSAAPILLRRHLAPLRFRYVHVVELRVARLSKVAAIRRLCQVAPEKAAHVAQGSANERSAATSSQQGHSAHSVAHRLASSRAESTPAFHRSVHRHNVVVAISDVLALHAFALHLLAPVLSVSHAGRSYIRSCCPLSAACSAAVFSHGVACAAVGTFDGRSASHAAYARCAVRVSSAAATRPAAAGSLVATVGRAEEGRRRGAQRERAGRGEAADSGNLARQRTRTHCSATHPSCPHFLRLCCAPRSITVVVLLVFLFLLFLRLCLIHCSSAAAHCVAPSRLRSGA